MKRQHVLGVIALFLLLAIDQGSVNILLCIFCRDIRMLCLFPECFNWNI